MRKVFIQCECGQRMQVARSAVGKIGMCPTCGRKMRISDGNTQPLADGKSGGASGRRPFWRNARWGRQDDATRDEAKRLFGRAADLFCNGQYGEAMALFDALVERFPGNPDIENARDQCLQARNRKPLGLPHPGGASPMGIATDREGLRHAVMDKLIDKLQHGSTDMVQLQAAELLARMHGFLDNGHSSEAPAPEEASEDAPPQDEQHDTEAADAADEEDAERRTSSASEEGENRETTEAKANDDHSPPPFDPADFEAELSSESAR